MTTFFKPNIQGSDHQEKLAQAVYATEQAADQLTHTANALKAVGKKADGLQKMISKTQVECGKFLATYREEVDDH